MKCSMIIAGICVLWSVFYIWTEYNWKPEQYFWTKGINSLLFICVGIAGAILGRAPKIYIFLILSALLFGLIGDLLLVYIKTPKFFIAGLSSFLIGQIIYSSAFITLGGVLIYDAIIFVVIMLLVFAAKSYFKLDFGDMKLPVAVYAMIIIFMFTMAVSLLYKLPQITLPIILISLGALLFIASDAVLAFVRFAVKPKPVLCGINLVLYYSTQILMALSIAAF